MFICGGGGVDTASLLMACLLSHSVEGIDARWLCSAVIIVDKIVVDSSSRDSRGSPAGLVVSCMPETLEAMAQLCRLVKHTQLSTDVVHIDALQERLEGKSQLRDDTGMTIRALDLSDAFIRCIGSYSTVTRVVNSAE